MMSLSTLTSLAMLKVNIDQGKDYLEYLRPFILQIFVDKRPDPVTDGIISDFLRDDFGLEIPARITQLLLKRISRSGYLVKENHVYRISGDIENPNIHDSKAVALSQINSVVSGLMDFSTKTTRPILSEDEAVEALLAFLLKFNIPCLKAYLRGTAIPDIEGDHHAHVIIVSQYVIHLQNSNFEGFERFSVLMQGHMLANALMCPDLQSAPSSFSGTTFFIDTPLVLMKLGFGGEARKSAFDELMALLKKQDGSMAVFSHTLKELNGVIAWASDHIDDMSVYTPIVVETRRIKQSRSDLLLLNESLDDKLRDAGIAIVVTPGHTEKYQVDEQRLDEVIEEVVSHHNPRAKLYDIESVRSIYEIRAGAAPLKIESSKAIFVTSNTSFARAAYNYGRDHVNQEEVPAVITDFSLANIAWLKSPMGAPSLPATEMLAFSYAALQPSDKFMSRLFSEIEKLQAAGGITEREHQLLRCSQVAHQEAMSLTLGDDEALSASTVRETLERVTRELTAEADEKLSIEQRAHQKTREDLSAENQKARIELSSEIILKEAGLKLQRDHYEVKSNKWSFYITAIIAAFWFIGLVSASSFEWKPVNPLWSTILLFGSAILFTISFIGAIFGFFKFLRNRIKDWLLAKYLERFTERTGFKIPDPGPDDLVD